MARRAAPPRPPPGGDRYATGRETGAAGPGRRLLRLILTAAAGGGRGGRAGGGEAAGGGGAPRRRPRLDTSRKLQRSYYCLTPMNLQELKIIKYKNLSGNYEPVSTLYGAYSYKKNKPESHCLTKAKAIQWPFLHSVYLSEHGWPNLNTT
ncbi:uncharacterized protein [Aphelocoma coerulescens]|uniref:uncharacterized protein isoform X2 n=1 Tax=Aphelocoma coerulescens TaxID=39617 RepID=UPI003604E5DE